MPTWSEYKSIAKERGSLAFELFKVESILATSPQEMQKHLPDHLAYQQKLESEGVLFMAGPLSDASGAQMSGSGMMLYRAKSIEEAIKIAENDPMHIAGIKTFTVCAWLINEGNISINVGFAAQNAKLI